MNGIETIFEYVHDFSRETVLVVFLYFLLSTIFSKKHVYKIAYSLGKSTTFIFGKRFPFIYRKVESWFINTLKSFSSGLIAGLEYDDKTVTEKGSDDVKGLDR